MAVLRSFTPADADGLGFTELGRRTGMAKGTLHRVLADMVAQRLLDRSGDTYHLGGLLFELGMLASREREFLEVAVPYLEDLRERTRETVHLGVREADEVVYLTKLGGHGQARTPSRPGGRMPLHATAIGKALLAGAPEDVRARVLSGPLERFAARTIVAPGALARHLDQVLAAGVSFEFEESQPGLVCVAAPVPDADGVPVAAVSIAGPLHRFDPRAHAAAVRATASAIASRLDRRRDGATSG